MKENKLTAASKQTLLSQYSLQKTSYIKTEENSSENLQNTSNSQSSSVVNLNKEVLSKEQLENCIKKEPQSQISSSVEVSATTVPTSKPLTSYSLQEACFDLIAKFGSYGTGFTNLNCPKDIVFNNNLIYIADDANSRIIILDFLLNYVNEIALISSPTSLASNAEYLLVGCTSFIIKFNLKTLQSSEIKGDNINFSFEYIYGMTTDKDNNLYVCDHINKEIIVFNDKDEFKRIFKINVCPKRLVINNNNQIVITCGTIIKVYDKFGNSISNYNFKNSNLIGIVCDSKDNYMICDHLGRLLLVDCNFNILKEFKIDKPVGITLNNNEIYVTEYHNHCVTLLK